MNTCKKIIAIGCLLTMLLLSGDALPVSAGTQGLGYVPLAPIGHGTNDTTVTCKTAKGISTDCVTLQSYLTGMFKIFIAVAGVLAFLVIVWGGFTYLSTDAIMGKEEGKERIERALGGLILAIAAYVILNTINPRLVELNLDFGKAADVKSGMSGSNGSFQDIETQLAEKANAARNDVNAMEKTATEYRSAAEELPDGDPKEAELISEAQALERNAAILWANKVAEQGYVRALNFADPKSKDFDLNMAVQEQGILTNSYYNTYNAVAQSGTPDDVKKLQLDQTDQLGQVAEKIAKADIERAILIHSYGSNVGTNTAIAIDEMKAVNMKAKEDILKAQASGYDDAAFTEQIDKKASQTIANIISLCTEKNLPCKSYVPPPTH